MRPCERRFLWLSLQPLELLLATGGAGVQVNVSVFGLGYVGSVSAACLARDGHNVVGVDSQEAKVDAVNHGASPILEPGLDELIAAAVRGRRLCATLDPAVAVQDTDISLVCVGTPSHADDSLNLGYLKRVARQIGEALASKTGFHVVVLRSTMLPGTMSSTVLPILQHVSGKRAGVDFGACVNPEFLREGSAIDDYDHPPKVVIGATDERTSRVVASLWAHLDAATILTSIDVAEITKYVDNAWHALKIAFANEVGVVCKAAGVDSHAVMDIFLQDTKLNLSASYLRPGFAFGGSCLPKDLRALTHYGRSKGLDLPLLSSVLPSNECHIRRSVHIIEAQGSRRVGILGISFKPGTDDLRESPIIHVIQALVQRGCALKVFDQNVTLANLTGANREYLFNVVPRVEEILTADVEELLSHAETVVIGKKDDAFERIAAGLNGAHTIVDLVRLSQPRRGRSAYQGLCW